MRFIKLLSVVIVCIVFLHWIQSFSYMYRKWNVFKFSSKLEIRQILRYDLLADDDLLKFVWVGNPFKNIAYEPNDLVKLEKYSNISYKNWIMLRQTAAENLEKMASDFYNTFGQKIKVISAYRSYDYQKNLISESCKQSWWCAREWESEHQLWLAVDLREATNKTKFLEKYQNYYEWLHENAYKYWFHQSYQKWRKIDGYYEEPRHWRYLWNELATFLYENNITFTQYVKWA